MFGGNVWGKKLISCKTLQKSLFKCFKKITESKAKEEDLKLN